LQGRIGQSLAGGAKEVVMLMSGVVAHAGILASNDAKGHKGSCAMSDCLGFVSCGGASGLERFAPAKQARQFHQQISPDYQGAAQD
jgi:hypothetical protein